MKNKKRTVSMVQGGKEAFLKSLENKLYIPIWFYLKLTGSLKNNFTALVFTFQYGSI